MRHNKPSALFGKADFLRLASAEKIPAVRSAAGRGHGGPNVEASALGCHHQRHGTHWVLRVVGHREHIDNEFFVEYPET
eukprot:SAG31_NODE_3901_length_3770_cov_4.494416_4_plen_79_part_00